MPRSSGAQVVAVARARYRSALPLAASPSDYAVTGVKSFIVSQDGVVYERDFGDDTADWFKSAVVFNPDAKWKPVQDAE